MSIIVPPAAVIATLGRQSWGQQRYDLLEESDVTGAVAVNTGGSPPRWRASMASQRGMLMAQAGAWQAMVLKLEGRRNHLALYDVLRAAPQGKLRGTLTLSGSVAIGATSVSLAGGLAAPNLIAGGGFETDTNADGLADGWTQYSGPGSGTITKTTPAASGFGLGTPGLCQRLQSTALSDALGITRSGIPVTAGLPYTLAVTWAATAGTNVVLQINWLDSGGATISFTSQTYSFTLARRSVTGTAPAGAVTASIFAFMSSAGGIATSLALDNAQFEQSATETAYAGVPTLLAGDMLQVGTGVGTSQLFSVVDDATGTDAGAITANVRSAARIAFSSGAAVAWDKPVAYFRQVDASTTWNALPNGPHIEGYDLDLLEDWNP